MCIRDRSVTQSNWVKMWFSRFPVLPGTTQAQVTWGCIVSLLIAYFIGNICAKKYQKSIHVCQSYSKPTVGRFLRHGVFLYAHPTDELLHLCVLRVNTFHLSPRLFQLHTCTLHTGKRACRNQSCLDFWGTLRRFCRSVPHHGLYGTASCCKSHGNGQISTPRGSETDFDET